MGGFNLMATTTNNGWATPDDTAFVYQGAQAMRTLGNAIDTSTGKGLIAWQSFAPTLSGGWLNGNGTWTASYAQLGKIVFVRAKFTVGSTTTRGTTLTISLPVTAAANQVSVVSTTSGFCTAGGVNTNLLWGNMSSTTTVTMFAQSAASAYLTRASITATVPATWATSDDFVYNLVYEAA
jgi:hypothetical protein